MENKPTCEIDAYGNKRWYVDGKIHREDGPAIILHSGTKIWWFNGEINRLDGPAIIRPNDKPEWWFNGVNVNDKITLWAEENDIDLDNLTEVDKALIKLVWGDFGK